MTGHESPIPAARLDALTDGVVAIVMTLLVLELHLPEKLSALDDAAVVTLLMGMREQLASYFLSFVVVGVLWMNHVQRFRHLTSTTASLVWLTLAFLGALSLVPFTTALLSRSPTSTATIVYAAEMAAAALMLALIEVHVDFKKLRVGEHQVDVWTTLLHFRIVAVFIVSIVVAFWSPNGARLCWLLIIPMWAVSHHVKRA